MLITKRDGSLQLFDRSRLLREVKYALELAGRIHEDANEITDVIIGELVDGLSVLELQERVLMHIDSDGYAQYIQAMQRRYAAWEIPSLEASVRKVMNVYYGEDQRESVLERLRGVHPTLVKRVDRAFKSVDDIRVTLPRALMMNQPITCSCAWTNFNRLRAFGEAFFMMQQPGVEVGVSLLREHLAQLPEIRPNDDPHVYFKIDNTMESCADSISAIIGFWYGASSPVLFDYSALGPLYATKMMKIHMNIDERLKLRQGTRLTESDIMGILNGFGECQYIVSPGAYCYKHNAVCTAFQVGRTFKDEVDLYVRYASTVCWLNDKDDCLHGMCPRLGKTVTVFEYGADLHEEFNLHKSGGQFVFSFESDERWMTDNSLRAKLKAATRSDDACIDAYGHDTGWALMHEVCTTDRVEDAATLLCMIGSMPTPEYLGPVTAALPQHLHLNVLSAENASAGACLLMHRVRRELLSVLKRPSVLRMTVQPAHAEATIMNCPDNGINGPYGHRYYRLIESTAFPIKAPDAAVTAQNRDVLTDGTKVYSCTKSLSSFCLHTTYLMRREIVWNSQHWADVIFFVNPELPHINQEDWNCQCTMLLD